MRHGPQCGNAVDLIRDGTGGADASADVCGTGSGHGGGNALCTTGSKFHYGTSLGSTDDTAGFRGDEALVVQGEQDIGLDQLRLNRGSLYRHKRLHGENGSSFGNGPDISGEFEIGQILQKSFGEEIPAAKIFNVFFFKVKILYVIDYLFQTCGDGEAALVGDGTVEHVKIRDLISHVVLEIAVSHGELIKIKQH